MLFRSQRAAADGGAVTVVGRVDRRGPRVGVVVDLHGCPAYRVASGVNDVVLVLFHWISDVAPIMSPLSSKIGVVLRGARADSMVAFNPSRIVDIVSECWSAVALSIRA